MKHSSFFSVEVPVDNESKMEEFFDLMNKQQDEVEKYIKSLATELDVSYGCACDVYYLRSRSRWTQELEDGLIESHKNGEVIDIYGNQTCLCNKCVKST